MHLQLFCLIILFTLTLKAEENPYSEKSNLANYNYLLNFNPIENNVSSSVIKLNYSVQENGLFLGGTELSSNTMKVYLGKPKFWGPEFKKIPIQESPEIFLVSFPTALFQRGKLEFITDSGSTFISLDTTDKMISEGDEIKKILGSKHIIDNLDPLTFLIGPLNRELYPLLNGSQKGNFKICLKSTLNKYLNQICSPAYYLNSKNKTIEVQNNKKQVPPMVKINNMIVNEKTSSMIVSENQEVEFLAISGKNYSVYFKTKVQPLQLIHFYQKEKENQIVMIGYSAIPTGNNTKVLNPEDSKSWLHKFGWLPTVGDFRTYWTTKIDLNNAVLNIPGEVGGLFTYELKMTKAPRKPFYIFLEDDTLTGTYDSVRKLNGFVSKNVSVSSTENSASVVNNKSGKFEWMFNAQNKGTNNTRLLVVNNEKDQWIAQKTLYRGYSNDFIFRAAGAYASQKQMHILGEINYNKWFEKILSSENPILSRQRWGLSINRLQYFKTLNFGNFPTQTTLSIIQNSFNLKYRFTPGISEKDATFGTILGIQDIKLYSFHTQLFGLGFFESRSLPQVFDKILNYIPFMNHEKWVDMDILLYPNHLKTNLDYELNFHGKLLVTKALYSELGFGFKYYGYVDPQLNNLMSLKIFYGTFGIGYNF